MQTAWTALKAEMGDDPVDYLHPAKVIRTILGAVAPDIRAHTLREAAALAESCGAVKPGDRIWLDWLRARADEIEAGRG